jgi:non-ribosomal peptide synthetase component F
MTLLAAFQTLLGRLAETEDVLVGSPIANRNRTEIEGLIGSFVNTLVLRGDLKGDPAFTDLIRRVRAVALDAYTHQDLPFEKIVAELQPARDLSYSPLFQVMFILQNTPMPVFQRGKLKFTNYDVDAGSSKLDLTLNLEETPEGCKGWLEYATDIFDRSTIQDLLARFENLLRAIVANPSMRLSELTSFLGESKQAPRMASSPTKIAETQTVSIPSARLSPPRRTEIPTTSVEKEIARIWTDVLGVPDVRLTDNLFDLGGHSLLVTRIISRVRKALDVEVPIHAFFETPTLGAIAQIVEEQLKAKQPVLAGN